LSLYDLAPESNEWHNLQQILIASGRAKHLVQQILAFSRQMNSNANQCICSLSWRKR
jgi:hypothetical protein